MKSKKKSSLLIALVITALCQPVWAAEADLTQTRPGDSQNLDAALRQKSAPQDTESPVEKQADQQLVQPEYDQDSSMKFLLTKLNVDSSDILTKAEIDRITAKYEGREVSLQDVNAAVLEINQLYAKKQNVIARAVLAPQKIQEGVVNIKLAESHVGQYRIEGTKYTHAEYLTQRMFLKSDDLLRLDQLEQDVIRFNKTNGSQLRVVLVKGEKFGTTDVVLKVNEQPREQTVLFSDNAGSETTGEYRAGAIWTINSLQSGGDSLTLNTTYAKGTTGGGISYQIPIDYRGTQLGVSYSKNQINIISGAFQKLEIEGDSTDASISINHPFKTTLDNKLSSFIELHKKTSNTYYSGFNPTPLTVKSVVMGLTEQKYYSGGMTYKRLDLTTGYAYNKFYDSPATRDAFAKINFSYANRMMLSNNGTILLRVSGQLNTNPEKNLPSTEQFALGGFSTVRGFKEGVLTGDKGYFISGEYHFPIGKTEGVVFLDHGGAFSYDGTTTPNNRNSYMTSIGIGMIANLAKNTSLQVFLGTPIDVPVAKGQYADGPRWHFYMQHML